MSTFFRKIGIDPKWGNAGSIKSFLKNNDFIKKLSEIRKKKMADPKIDVSKEIRDLLESERE